MFYSPTLLAIAAASGALAQQYNGHSLASTRLLSRDTVSVSLTARQLAPANISPGAEYCGTDTTGLDWWCEDPSTTCCFGTEIWQCIPITAEECCTTGYYCDPGTHCYLGLDDGIQYCIAPDEEEELSTQPDDSSSFHPSRTAAAAIETGGAGDDEEEEESGSVGIGGIKSGKKGGKKDGPGSNKSEGQRGSVMNVLFAIPAVAGLVAVAL